MWSQVAGHVSCFLYDFVSKLYLLLIFFQEWRSANQGRNNPASRYNREGIYISHSSRAFRDEEGKHFWVEMEIIDKYRVPSGHQGPYNVTVRNCTYLYSSQFA